MKILSILVAAIFFLNITCVDIHAIREQQVLIDSKIVEVDQNAARELGFDFSKEFKGAKIHGKIFRPEPGKITAEVIPKPFKKGYKVDKMTLIDPKGKKTKSSEINSFASNELKRMRDQYLKTPHYVRGYSRQTVSDKDWVSTGSFDVDATILESDTTGFQLQVDLSDKVSKKTKIKAAIDLSDIPILSKLPAPAPKKKEPKLERQPLDLNSLDDLTKPMVYEVPQNTTNAADAVVGQAIGGLLGGGGGSAFGGGGRKKKKKKPKLAKKPKYTESILDCYDGKSSVKISGGMKDGNPQLTLGVDKSPDKGVPHLMILQNLRNGIILIPIRIRIFELWVKITLTVSWTRTYYQDGQMVGQESGGWSTSWKERWARVVQIIRGPAIWMRLGKDPFDSFRGIIADYEMPQGMVFVPSDWRVIIHITGRAKRRGFIRTRWVVARLGQNDKGHFTFKRTPENEIVSPKDLVVPEKPVEVTPKKATKPVKTPSLDDIDDESPLARPGKGNSGSSSDSKYDDNPLTYRGKGKSSSSSDRKYDDNPLTYRGADDLGSD